MTTWTNSSKNTSSYTNQLNLGRLQYLLTDAQDYILVGEDEDETLILWDDTGWSNISKS